MQEAMVLDASPVATEKGRPADEVDGEDADGNHEPWRDPEPEHVFHNLDVLGLVEHIAPAGGRHLNAEAEEAETGLCEDGAGDAEAGGHGDGRDHVGQDVTHDNPFLLDADGLRGHYIVCFANGENEAADEAGNARPADESDREHGVEDAGAEDGNERDENDEDGECHDGIGYPHDHGIYGASVVTGNAAQDGTDGDKE